MVFLKHLLYTSCVFGVLFWLLFPLIYFFLSLSGKKRIDGFIYLTCTKSLVIMFSQLLTMSRLNF